MQITNTTTPTNYKTKTDFLPVRRFEQQPQDTFVKTPEIVPSFRGTIKIDKNTMQKASVLAAAIAASLYTLYEQEDKEADTIELLHSKVDTLQQELEKCRKENKTLLGKFNELRELLKTKFNELTNIHTSILQSASEKKETVECIPNDGETIINFPPKLGRLSRLQEQLKSIVKSTPVPESSANKLFDICKALISKEDLIINNEKIDKNKLIEELITKLSDKNTDKQSVVEDFYNRISNNSSDKADTTTQAFNRVASSNPTGGIKLVGKISQEELINRTSNKPKTTIEEGENGSYIYKIQKQLLGEKDKQDKNVLKQNIKTHLTKALNFFAVKFKKSEQFDKSTMKLMYKYSLPYEGVTTDMISEELLADENGFSNIRTYGLPKSAKGKSNKLNERYNDIANAINNDSRFKEYFTLHGALRLIERFVNFSSKTSISEQCKQILDELEQLLIKQLEDGVEMMPYLTEKTKKNFQYYGARLILHPKSGSVLGTGDIKIGLCKESDKVEKVALISSIMY